MPYPEGQFDFENENTTVAQTWNRGGKATGSKGVVFSATKAYNPTSLAVETSLREIFDEFEELIAGELKLYTTKEEDGSERNL